MRSTIPAAHAIKPWSAYDKWNISVLIVTQICHSGQQSHGGDRNIFEVMISPLPKGTLASVASVLAVSSITEILIGDTRSRISYHLRDIYSICMCCWNGATHKWKVHNGKTNIIYFGVKFPPWLCWPLWHICVTMRTDMFHLS
jgi:hypothetical protein